MTPKQFDHLAELLADKHCLSYQLTRGWMKDHGVDLVQFFGTATLSPAQIADLIWFAGTPHV